MSTPMTPARLLATSGALVAALHAPWSMAASPEAALPPVAEVKNVPGSFHGSVVPDPYRWMEDMKSAQSQTWLAGQSGEARSVLDRI